jgi:UDP-glucuronate 4-epimerase
LYNNGDHLRDFTYIDDIVNGVIACFAPDLDGVRGKENLYRVYNVGCQNPVKLLDFVDLLEVNLGIKAERVLKPMQPGDVYATYANSNQLTYDKGWMPKVQLREGIALFSDWFKSYNS